MICANLLLVLGALLTSFGTAIIARHPTLPNMIGIDLSSLGVWSMVIGVVILLS